MRQIVLADDFLKDNYLSTELRVPSTLLQTNVCSPLATNAIAATSGTTSRRQSYKELPSVGTVKVRHPVTGAASDYPLPGGGRGFTRPASLVSVWSTAPFLQNNSVGRFDPSPSVEARMRVFQDSIEKMLWPERREKDPIFANDNGAGVGVIDRTDQRERDLGSRRVRARRPAPLLGVGQRVCSRSSFRRRLGGDRADSAGLPGQPAREHRSSLGADDQTAQGTARAQRRRCCGVLKQAKDDLKDGSDTFANPDTIERFLSLSKCPDFVVNKGHYFGTNLQTEEPRARATPTSGR